MQYNENTPQKYLAALEPDWRKDTLLQLRDIVLQQDANISESINYKMLCFSFGEHQLFHLNAQKNYVSFYCGDTKKVDPQGELLRGLNLGKGCIRFTKTIVVADTKIEKFIRQAINLHNAGHDIGC